MLALSFSLVVAKLCKTFKTKVTKMQAKSYMTCKSGLVPLLSTKIKPMKKDWKSLSIVVH